jgi:uncharacterized membrane-anchored protein
LNQNLPGGNEVMIAPEDLHWSAYFSFADDGYVKDDEKIDAAELLKSMQQGTEEANKERRRRGWRELHVLDWAVPPAYNDTNQRLEWATLLQGEGGRSVNFSTKVLGRRGHTSVILAAGEEDLAGARPELEQVLAGYSFNVGERYADWVPGDKVAGYGLAALGYMPPPSPPRRDSGKADSRGLSSWLLAPPSLRGLSCSFGRKADDNR